MQMWSPEPGEPERLDWWRPLEAVCLRARTERLSTPVRVDEFRFRGRVDRGGRPAVWIYEHRGTGREMLADADGRTYEFVQYRSGRQLGRFNEIGVWPAVLRVRLGATSDPDRPRVVRRRHLSLVPTLPNPN